MTKSFLIAGIVLGVLAILCGIGALATANWMKVRKFRYRFCITSVVVLLRLHVATFG